MAYHAPIPANEVTHHDDGFEVNRALAVVTPQDRAVMRERAQTAAKSGLFKDITTPERAMVIIETGRTLGIPEMAALRGIYIIEGRPFVSASLILAIVRKSRICKQIVINTNSEGATCKMVRADDGFEFTSTFGPAEAKRAGLDRRDTYLKHPDQMYMHRAVARCARVVCPEIFYGLGIEGEGVVASLEEPEPLPDEHSDLTVNGQVITDEEFEQLGQPKQEAQQDSRFDDDDSFVEQIRADAGDEVIAPEVEETAAPARREREWWNCGRDLQLQILKFWRMLIEAGVQEKVLRDHMDANYGTRSRKLLSPEQGRAFLAVLTRKYNSLISKPSRG